MNQRLTKLVSIAYILIELISFLNYSIFEIFNRVNVYFTFFTFVILYIINIDKFKKSTILLLTFIIFLTLLTLISTNGSIGSIITIFNILIGIEIFTTIELNKKEQKIVMILICTLLILYGIKSENAYYLTLYGGNDNFNSNTVGQIIMCCTIILSVYISNTKMKKSTLLIIIINIIGLNWALKCQSRGSSLGIIIFLMLYIFKNKFIKNNRAYKLILILVILGTIFPLIYVNLYQNNVDFKIPFINKSLYTGREYIWYNVMEGFKSQTGSVLFGLGSNFQIVGWETLNLHNMYWAIIVNFGIISYFLIILFFKQILYNKCNTKNIIPLFPIVINGYVENGILWTATLIFLCLIVNLIANEKKIT